MKAKKSLGELELAWCSWNKTINQSVGEGGRAGRKSRKNDSNGVGSSRTRT